MIHHGNGSAPRRAMATLTDIQEERQRLHESRMLLVLMAERVGLAVPRSCCPHAGKTACLSCSSDWLVSHVRLARAAFD